MKKLNQIRDTLTDPSKRAAYDAVLRPHQQTSSNKGEPAEKAQDWFRRLMLGQPLWIWTTCALLLGVVVGSWTLLRWMPRRIIVNEVQVTSPAETPSALPSRSSSEALPNRSGNYQPAQKASSKPQVVQVGSSLDEILAVMGKPDRVEETPSRGLRVLHYGKLALTLHNGKMVQGEMKDADN